MTRATKPTGEQERVGWRVMLSDPTRRLPSDCVLERIEDKP